MSAAIRILVVDHHLVARPGIRAGELVAVCASGEVDWVRRGALDV